MIAGFSILFIFTVKSHNIPILIMGNLFSLFCSYMTAKVTYPYTFKELYFAPFNFHTMIIAISVVIITIQVIALEIMHAEKIKEQWLSILRNS